MYYIFLEKERQNTDEYVVTFITEMRMFKKVSQSE